MQGKHVRNIILISLFILAVYFNSLWVNFIWDDTSLILENPLIKSFSQISKILTTNLSLHQGIFYRPLQNLLNMLDFSLYKFDYRGYHLTNILLHILASVLFYRLLFMLTCDINLSFHSALLYSVCPLWVESVSYISGRADILMAIFIALSFIYFIKERISFALLFYCFALLSKEASIVYPLTLILYIYLFRKKGKKAFYQLMGFLTITLIYIIFRLALASSPLITSQEHSLYVRILFFIKAIPEYLALLFFPINQHMSYTVKLDSSFFRKEVLASFLGLIFIIFLYFYFLKKEKTISFFIGWFFIMLLPYSGIFPINAFFAEHFIYIASLGILVIFVYFLQKLNSKRIFKLVFFGYLAVFSIATIKYNFVWQDQVKLYQRIIKLSPNSFAAYNNLGVIYLTQGRLKAAESMIKKSLEVYPECIEARVNLARFYYFKKDYSTAIGLVKAVVENDPRNFEALDFLGTFYFKNKEFDLAEYCYKKAMAVNPYYLPIWLDLYSFYKSLGREKEAVAVREEIKKIDRYSLADLNFADAQELFLENKIDKPLVLIDEALKVDPYNSDYYNLKGAILRRSGNYAQALDSFRKALKISPVNYEAYNNLGNLFAMIGDFDKARMNFKKSISLNPDFTEGYFNLGLLYFMLKNKPEAERLFRKALSLNPNHSLAKEYLDKIQKER